MLSYDIIDATHRVRTAASLVTGYSLAVSIELALTDDFTLGLGDAGAGAGAFLLAGLFG
jgi:hypothetical protein